MRKRIVNGVVYFTFDIFDNQPINHCFSSRIGGVSTGFYESMNLSFTLGNDKDNVRENFNRICAATGFSAEDLVFTAQTHGTNIRRVGKNDAGKWITGTSDITDIDAITTNEPGVVLTGFFADCVPVYLYDPVKKAVSIAHAGWRGTLAEIGRLTVERMTAEYGSDPENIIVGIGPSICADCFEVGNDVAPLFADKFKNGGGFVKKCAEEGKYLLDLWALNKYILENAGVKGDNIEVGGICTKCSPDLFYSHRRSGLGRGGMAAFIGL